MQVEKPADVPLRVLIPAFVTSELKTAFQIGFMLFLPFLVIDLVVASILMAMGMMMLSPMIVSLPFKLMLFVMVDGWNLILGHWPTVSDWVPVSRSNARSPNMSPETFVDVFREALWLVNIMVSAVILPSLAIGLVVAIFQRPPPSTNRP